jgi:hypothetical protein
MIVDATVEHVRSLGGRLRTEDALEITSLGETPRSALWHSFRGSPFRRTVLVDGKVAGMWGVHGDLMGERGTPWFLTAPEIERIPVFVVKQGRQEVARMLRIYPHLSNYVLASYCRAVRFISLLGFTVEDATLIRGVPFRRFWRTV